MWVGAGWPAAADVVRVTDKSWHAGVNSQLCKAAGVYLCGLWQGREDVRGSCHIDELMAGLLLHLIMSCIHDIITLFLTPVQNNREVKLVTAHLRLFLPTLVCGFEQR